MASVLYKHVDKLIYLLDNTQSERQIDFSPNHIYEEYDQLINKVSHFQRQDKYLNNKAKQSCRWGTCLLVLSLELVHWILSLELVPWI